MPVKLVEVIRGGITESLHRGDIAVVDCKGGLICELGDSSRLTFFRSAEKPFIAIAALETGIVEQYHLTTREIAIMTSSHSGENEHIDVLTALMKKVNVNEDELKCGTHEPVSKEAADELIRSGKSPTKLHCNCSGKHVGLLAAAGLKGLDKAGYTDKEFQLQKEIEKVISEFCNVKPEKIVYGVDGCGLPVHAVPLKNIAYAFANLSNLEFLEGKHSKAQKLLTNAMAEYPEMVAGKGRLDTELMKRYSDRVICKMGAEALFCASLREKGMGIAIKIDDGNSRAAVPAAIEALVQLNVLTREEAEPLKPLWNPELKNNSGNKVGEIKAKFKISPVDN